tara:strand:+ start:1917 stop:2234 length:318 start_codon:yes stop_codon:yes gene_type:complete
MLKIIKKEGSGTEFLEVTLELPTKESVDGLTLKSTPHEVESFIRDNIKEVLKVENLAPMGNYREDIRIKAFKCRLKKLAPSPPPVKQKATRSRKKKTTVASTEEV